ncbi:MAG: 30S ribosomal protein S12 methylthiotransferase RimO [Clostridia bacterium]|nr:30S ribosomal protein S12 methylthiotransferase RimO [Clostridia bacterium]
MAYSVGAISLGCNKNRVDTETALGLLRDRGFRVVSDPAQADILMVNTCGFIDPAKEESINTILEMAEYKQTGKCKLLVVTGCLSQRYEKDLMQELPEIDLLLGVNQYATLPDQIEKALGGQRIHACQDDLSYFEQDRLLTTPFYTAYTRIGEGCSNHCTFCAIPLIRGPYRSRGEEEILREVSNLAARGVREHVLVAQDTTRWGTDKGGHTQLPRLMKKLAQIPGVDWLRVLYCYPDETNEELLDLLADTPNICPYLDIPIQHINSDILKRMHRLGSREDILRCVEGAKKRGLTLRTTLITGFPGETEEQFQELLDFVKEAEFDRLGAFTYSPEEGTAAARMQDQIPEEVKQERLDRLMTLQAEISLKKNQARLGQVEQILVTDVNEAEALALGRSRLEAPETDGEIVFHYGEKKPEIGSFVPVRLTQAETYDLMGEML